MYKIIYRDMDKFKVELKVDFDVDFLDYNYYFFLNEEVLKEKQIIWIFCWVMISLSMFYMKGKLVKEMWGKCCNKLLFMSLEEDIDFFVIGLDVREGWD